MNNPLTTLNRLMSRVKRTLGLPDSISVLGLIRMCPILALLSLLILVAVGVMVLG